MKKETGFGAGHKAQKAQIAANEYHSTHSDEIAMYEKAEKYLRDVLQGRFDPKKLPPVTKWKSEIVKLTAERKLIEANYNKLCDEVKESEQIRKSIYSIVRAEHLRTQPHRAHNIEL